MPISFNQIPLQIGVPGQYTEFDNSNAIRGLPGMPSRVLMFAVPNAGSPAMSALDMPKRILSADEAAVFGGIGSMLHAMACVFYKNNSSSELFICPVNDASGQAATKTITMTSIASAAGTLRLYVGGQRVSVGIVPADALADIAANIAAAITADTTLPVTATAAAAVVTITAKFKGEIGSDLSVLFNYAADDVSPAGFAATIATGTPGSGGSSLANAIAASSNSWYTDIITPFNDSTSLTNIAADADLRWGPLNQKDYHAYAAKRGTASILIYNALTRNNPHMAVLAVADTITVSGKSYLASNKPTYWHAASFGAYAALLRQIDPARPFQNVPLYGLEGGNADAHFTPSEREQLLKNGMATYKIGAGGVSYMERARTSYRLNTFGMPDASYADSETMWTLSLIRYSLNSMVAQKFPRHKIADDGTRYGAGQAVVTPRIMRSQILVLFTDWESQGLVEGFDQFSKDLIVERDANDVSRMNVMLPTNLINQFRIFAGQVKFIL